MTILIGKNCEQVLAELRLVDAQTSTYVLLQQHPVRGVILLRPFLEIAQMMLVVALQRAAVNLKVSLQRAGRYRVGVQIFFLRHQRTP